MISSAKINTFSKNTITIIYDFMNINDAQFYTSADLKKQKNHKFTSFFLEFLDLVNELNWNESVKIAALWHAISDEIHAQLVTQKMSKILSEFAILYQ